MYHRVARVGLDPWGIAVSPERFEEQMDYLKRHRAAMPMDELVHLLSAGMLPDDAVAITFDDGYRDNLMNAKPLLTRYGLPGCLFLTTGNVDSGEAFWWDELASMVMESPGASHCEQVCGKETIPLNWHEADELDHAQHDWKAWDEPRTSRQKAYLAIWRILRQAPQNVRDAVMESLRLRFAATPDTLAMPMTGEEVRALLEGGLITLAAHSVTHPALTGLSEPERKREMELSRQRCQTLSNTQVKGFAYPHGDMNPKVQKDAADLGYSWACSTEGSWLDGAQRNLYALPRIAVPNAPLRIFLSLL